MAQWYNAGLEIEGLQARALSNTLNPLLSTGSTQKDPSRHERKNVDWDVNNRLSQKTTTKNPNQTWHHAYFNICAKLYELRRENA